MGLYHGAIPASLGDPLFDSLRLAAPDRPFVIAQLGQSLDGRIATPTGESRWINRGAALDHLHRLRAHVDAVIVGVGTVVEDDPQLTVRRVRGRDPARVIIDPDGRMPERSRCLDRNGARRIVVMTTGRAGAGGAETLTLPRDAALIRPHSIVSSLFDLGLRKILVEGGAKTISAFMNAGAVDRLHVLVAPVILGSGTPGLSLAPIAGLDEALRPRTRVHVLDDGDVLFDCDLRQRDQG